MVLFGIVTKFSADPPLVIFSALVDLSCHAQLVGNLLVGPQELAFIKVKVDGRRFTREKMSVSSVQLNIF